jgi:hypothetical protein
LFTQLLQLLQVLQLPHDLWQLNKPLNGPPHFLRQPVLQLLHELQLLQAGASQQVGSAAQQAGSAWQQVGSQAGAQLEQLDLQLWQANRPLKPPNRWRWPQPELQLLQLLHELQLPQAGASQQVGSAAQQPGSAAQHVGSAAAQQVGSAAQHVGSEQLLQQLLQPPQPPER